jgi:hypothetical protein
MPTTVHQLFSQFNIKVIEGVQWANKINQKGFAIYIVSTSDDPNQNNGISPVPAVDNNAVLTWRTNSSMMKVHGQKLTLHSVQAEFSKFWHVSENILYIGKASEQPIHQRVNFFYKHIIGNDPPHGGGQWIKALAGLPKFYVYYGFCSNAVQVEFNMLRYFAEKTSGRNFDKLSDPCLYIPFANRELKYNGYCRRKQHGFKK